MKDFSAKTNPILQKELHKAILTDDFNRMNELVEHGARVKAAELNLATESGSREMWYRCEELFMEHKSITEMASEGYVATGKYLAECWITAPTGSGQELVAPGFLTHDEMLLLGYCSVSTATAAMM